MDGLVTVIVPVYNVEQYLDRCIESIVKQTYTNLEILLINDGSTDDSLKKCLEWKNKDARIKVIDKENEGQGPARNVGIEKASGDWLICVDSDDWVKAQYVEKLLYAVLENDADMAVCNYLTFYEKTQEEKVWYGVIEKESLLQTQKEKMCYMSEEPIAAVYAKIYKKSLLINNQIKLPAVKPAEDLAVLVQTIACAKKIVLITDALYYYWRDRSTSTTNSVNKSKYFTQVFHYSVNEMKRLGLFEKYCEGQLLILYEHLSFMLKNYTTHEAYMKMKEEYLQLFNEIFSGWQNKVGMNWLVHGSFNARWFAHICSHSIICTPKHYTFSSLISQFLGKQGYQYELEHDNPFRKNSVADDIRGICRSIDIKDERGILIDFLDERNDIIETEDGVYISCSEAFEECKVEGLIIKRVVSYTSYEYMQLWEEACLKFIKYLRNRMVDIPIYLLKMRMAKGYGIGQIEKIYDDQEDIEIINKKIEEMELFFLMNCPEAIYIQGKKELYYTLEGHAYGTMPWNLNKQLYRDMSKKMEQLKENNGYCTF